MHTITRRSSLLSGAITLIAVLGCGKGATPNPTAVVSGKVTLAGGKPLTGGRINFLSATDGSKAATGEIKADGTYEVAGVPQGECKVSVDNVGLKPVPNPTAADTPPDPSLKYVPINAKYANPSTSGLTTTISGSTATYSVELK